LSQVLSGAGGVRHFWFSRVVSPEGVRDGLVFAFCEVLRFMQIMVRDNNVDQALRALKKKLQREGVYREMKLRRHFEKPSEKRAREKAAAVRRARKLERKRLERDGAK
jgi:small subunit ribosomal protein S21